MVRVRHGVVVYVHKLGWPLDSAGGVQLCWLVGSFRAVKSAQADKEPSIFPNMAMTVARSPDGAGRRAHESP